MGLWDSDRGRNRLQHNKVYDTQKDASKDGIWGARSKVMTDLTSYT